MRERSAVYTLEQLLEAAAELNLDATERLVVDWVGHGLLDRPKRQGKGQGRGSLKGTWPAEQRQLFLTLLKKRPEVKRIATLANIPVGIWLLWGEQFVPLRQARKALGTWAGSQYVSIAAARRAARQLADDFGTRLPRHKTALIEYLTDALHGKQPDIATLRQLIQDLGQGQQLQTGGIQFSITPEAAVQLFSARLEALRELRRFPDSLFHWARFTYHVGRAGYAPAAATLSEHEHFAHIFQDTSLAAILNRACLDLLTTLGMSRIFQFDQKPMELANPLAWEQGNLKSRILRTRQHAGGLELEVEILPAGPAP